MMKRAVTEIMGLLCSGGSGGDKRGFTLLEVLIAMAITGMIALAVYNVIVTAVNTLDTVEFNSDLMQRVRIPAFRLSQELRCARRFVSADSNSVEFEAVYDYDHDLSADTLIIRYYLPSGSDTLKRRRDSLPGHAISTGVRSFHLRYYRPDGSGLNTPLPEGDLNLLYIDRVRFSLLFEREGHLKRLESEVSVRNPVRWD